MKIRYMILALASLFALGFLTVITYFAAFAVTFMTGAVDTNDVDTVMVNQGIFSLIRYTVVLVICGYWYLRYLPGREVRSVLKKTFNPINIVTVLLFAFSAQLMFDGFMYLLTRITTHFASAYELGILGNYERLVESFTTSTDLLFVLMTITLGPVAEELVFRGLCLRYAKLAFEEKGRAGVRIAIIFQAVLFGLFHGNLVQMIYGTIFGILLGILADVSDSLIPSTFVHILLNFCFYVASLIPFSNIPEGIALFVAGTVIMVVAYRFYKSRISIRTEEVKNNKEKDTDKIKKDTDKIKKDINEKENNDKDSNRKEKNQKDKSHKK